MNPRRPTSNDPPRSYRIDCNEAVFYRRISQAEFESIKTTGQFLSKPGTMDFGKHLTTTLELARAWGQAIVNQDWEQEIGIILEVRLPLDIAEQVYFVGARTDAIGASYFASIDQLRDAKLSEVNP